MYRQASGSATETVEDWSLDFLTQPRFSQMLQRVVRHAAYLTQCPVAFLYACIDRQWVLLSTQGLGPLDSVNWRPPRQKMVPLGATTFEVGDLATFPLTKDSTMVLSAPHLRYSIGTPVECRQLVKGEDYIAIWCVDFQPRTPSADRVKSLVRFADIASNVLELIHDLWRFEARQPELVSRKQDPSQSTDLEQSMIFDPAAAIAAPIIYDIASRFLSETLIHQQRLLRRGDRIYFSARSWRKSIKTYQIDAVRQLKHNPPDHFIDMICIDLEKLVVNIVGKTPTGCIVPVPCGHSGPNCLARRVAERLAERLRLPCEIAFADLVQKGSSHPKTNVKRPAMTLVKEVQGPVILIDDIATSGSHITEAASIVGRFSDSVTPLAWIAD